MIVIVVYSIIKFINGGTIKENSNLTISYADEIIKQLKKL